MAPPLHFGGAPIEAQVALSSEIDVRRPAERGQAKTEPAHDEPGRTELARRYSFQHPHQIFQSNTFV